MPPSLNIGTQCPPHMGIFTGATKIRATVGGTRNAELSHSNLDTSSRCSACAYLDRIPWSDLVDSCKFYRITARGFGVNPNSQVTLQEIFEGEI